MLYPSSMLNKDFLSGHYQKTIAWSLGQKNVVPANELPSLIGSLCFAGNLLEAKRLYKESYKNLNDSEKAACRFFLGLLYTRKSQYKKASKIFRNNLKSLHKESDSLQRFYVYQGIAFYLFFVGKFQLSLKWALKAFDAAIDTRDLYARSLSTDLLAHIKLRLGEINVGLDLLKSAEKLSVQLGNKSLSEAIQGAKLQYQAQYGYLKNEIVKILEEKLESLVTEDNYSRAAIGLELARQYTLRGQYDLAEKILEQISSNIFSSENRRQEIQLNLRFAENFYQMGKSNLAWNYVRTARRCLNYEADKNFEMQIMGLEHKLFDGVAKKAIEEELINKSRYFNNIINHNILLRKNIIEADLLHREDLFHDFILSLEGENDKISRVIESGYWSLLSDILEVKRGESLLYLNAEMNQVVFFSDRRIEVVESHLTPTDIKILLCVLNGHGEKASLCKKVWGYDYDPLRHDNVIYTAIRSLRKNLGTGGSWIETNENGYYFSAERKFKIHERNRPGEFKKEEAESFESVQDFSSQLNLRQIKSLRHLKKHEYLDVLTYQELFSVSDVTASRDLRSLKKLGYVVSIGKARATKYLLAEKRT